MAETSCKTLPEAITPENRNDKIAELFGESWLADYLGEKLSYDALNDKQKALASAIDGVMVGMLDPNTPDEGGKLLIADTMSDLLKNDGYIDMTEWNWLLDDATVKTNSDVNALLSDLEAQMGEAHAKALRKFTSGVMAGMADEEADPRKRYLLDEAEPFYSPRAIALLRAANSQSVMSVYMNSGNPLADAITNMNDLCATIIIQNIERCDDSAAELSLPNHAAKLAVRVV